MDLQDIDCEEKCQFNLKSLQKFVNKEEILDAGNENELCHSNCIIPRKGNNDHLLCIEKCNIQHNLRLSNILHETFINIKDFA